MIYILMIVAGVGLAAYGLVAHRRGAIRYAAARARWTQTVATIDNAWLERMETNTSDGSLASYRARVAYRYLADGAERHGSRPFLCGRVNFTRQRDGAKWLAQVLPGSTVPVWYDPAQPDDAALQLNRPSRSLAIVLGAVGLGLAALGLLLRAMP